MKKQILCMLAVILTTSGLMTALTSCSSDDDKANNVVLTPGPLAEQIEGIWFCNYEAKGTIADAQTKEAKEYSHVIETYQFKKDGSSKWNRYYFIGGYSKAVTELGGGDGSLGSFDYATQADGTITVKLKGSDKVDDSRKDAYTPQQRTLRLTDSKLKSEGLGGKAIEFVRDTIELGGISEQWIDMLYSGGNSSGNTQEIDTDVSDVKYTILKDKAMTFFDILGNMIDSPKKDPLLVAAIAEKQKENAKARAATRGIDHTTLAPSGYRTVDFTYESIDEAGKPVTLSGRAVWGVHMLVDGYSEIKPNYILLTPHFTITDNYECPTSGRTPENLLMVGDRLIIMPDYLGFGVTKDRVQPYVIHDLCARNSIDALRAGYKVFRDLSGVSLENDWSLYVAGVSQGAGNALAIHKWLDTHLDFADRWRFKYSYCGAGPYSPRITFEEYFKQKKLVYPVVMPITIKAMLASYPDILGKWKEEEFFSDSYLKRKSEIDMMINSKEYTSDEINEFIFSIYPHTGETDIKGGEEVYLADMLSDDALNTESELCQKLFECLDKNDLTTGWALTHPIHLYHAKNDMIVSYANAEAVKAAFPDKTEIKGTPLGNEDHIATCLLWLLSIAAGDW